MAHLLCAFGYRIGHETMDDDGTSCWSWAVADREQPWSPGPRPDLSDWMVFHVYRNPLYCIPAIAADSRKVTLDFYHRHIGYQHFDPIVRAAKVYIHWNRAAAELRRMHSPVRPEYSLNVETAADVLACNLGRKPIGIPKRDTNTRAGGKRKPITWRTLEIAAPEFVSEIRELSRSRGYAEAA
jgi:hypothetical protein